MKLNFRAKQVAVVSGFTPLRKSIIIEAYASDGYTEYS